MLMLRSLLLALPTVLALPLALPHIAAAQEQWYEGNDGAPANNTSANSAVYAGSNDVAPPDDGTGLGIGLRLGYGLPFGKIDDDDNFDDFAAGEVVTQFDLTYAFTPNIVAGAYFGLNFGVFPEERRDFCDENDIDCSLFFLTTGLAGEYRILPGKLANPWVGANFGLEWGVESARDGIYDDSMSVFGLAFGGAAGLDFELGRWGLGPFLNLQAGRFLSVDTDTGASGDIEERAFHYWLQLGARARYTFAH